MSLEQQLIAAFRAWDGQEMALAASAMLAALLDRSLGVEEVAELDWTFRELLEDAVSHPWAGCRCDLHGAHMLLSLDARLEDGRVVALGLQFTPAFIESEALQTRWRSLGFTQERHWLSRGELNVPVPFRGEPGHAVLPSIHVPTQADIATDQTWAAGRSLADGRGPWLRRYRAGDHEAVWREMLQLGAAVRKPDVFGDAVDVALETMRQARDGIQALYARLMADGYQFLRSEEAFLPASGNEEQSIAELEQIVGPIPMSLRAFYSVVGSVSFCGEHPAWELSGEAILDPLVVFPPDYVLNYDEDRWRRLRYQLEFAPGRYHKDDISGGAPNTLLAPDGAVDGRVVNHFTEPTLTFVDLLRRSLKFAGFPGWSTVPVEARPQEQIARLTRGLTEL